MSKAFTKEDDGGVPELPDRPVSDHPNHVTTTGYARLEAQRDELAAELADLRARKDTLDDLLPIAVAERDLRYTEARLRSAIVVDLSQQPKDRVSFGAEVITIDEDGREATYRIVSEDNADPRTGAIAPFSPLAQALMEQGVGDVVEWPKPTGTIELEIVGISYPDG